MDRYRRAGLQPSLHLRVGAAQRELGVPYIAHDPQQQAHSMAMYYMLKSLDTTRLVISNDGWELTHTDICAIHNYTHGATPETENTPTSAGRSVRRTTS